MTAPTTEIHGDVAGHLTSGRFAWRNVRAVTPSGVVDDATVVVDDGVIVEIAERGAAPEGAVDGHGLLLVPGLVDCHSDGLEKEIAPRSSVRLPLDFALRSFEARVRAVGITTVFHGVGFQDKPAIDRSIEAAEAMCDAIAAHHERPDRLVDHGILFRFEALDANAFEPMVARIDATRDVLPGHPPIVSFEDHTPGQGQYRDIDRFAAMIATDPKRASVDADAYVRRLVDEAAVAAPIRDRNLAAVARLAHDGTIRLLAHDGDTAESIDLAVGAGAAVAEFPVSLEAARRARDHGLAVVMGAPNALRGTSHSGNISARELVAAGLCDALASDYLPSSLLAAALALATDGVIDLAGAVHLVTAGPAQVAGCGTLGRIEVGAPGDIALVDDRGRWPVVTAVHRRADDHTRRLLHR